MPLRAQLDFLLSVGSSASPSLTRARAEPAQPGQVCPAGLFWLVPYFITSGR